MTVCAISFKECWQEADGRWYSYGGFPLQMAAVASLFDSMTLLVVRAAPRAGGVPLPAAARVVPLQDPAAVSLPRKLAVIRGLPHYLRVIGRHVRAADVVHVPLPGDLPLIGLLAALALRKPVIARYGGSWFPTSQTTWMNRVTRASMRLAAGGRNVMLATGDGAEPPAPGMHWLFTTAIAEAEVAAVRPDLDRLPGRPLRLVYAGRLSREKGVRYLVEAVGRLRARGLADRLTLVLAGDGPQRAELEALVAAEGVADHVHFAGQLGRRALLDHLGEADVCVLPSLTESYCKARLDAMLCGTPVVTTPVGFGREIVGTDGERGWVVPAADADALAARLGALAAEELDWPALRRRCRAYVEEKTLEAWAREMGAIAARQWRMSFTEGKLIYAD